MRRLFHACLDSPVESQVEVRDGAVHAADVRRERALLAAGYVRRGFTAGDLTTRAAATVRELEEMLGRASHPLRLRRWRELVDPSTLTSAGVRRLARRWKVADRT